jgi:hypothetical protein
MRVEMDSAPNFRGTGNNEFSGNVMLRTRPLRVAGDGNRIMGNFIACPLQPFTILVSHGSNGYRPATNSLITGNTLIGRAAIRFVGQEQPVTQPAIGNSIANNSFFAEQNNPPIIGDHKGNNTEVENSLVIIQSGFCKN